MSAWAPEDCALDLFAPDLCASAPPSSMHGNWRGKSVLIRSDQELIIKTTQTRVSSSLYVHLNELDHKYTCIAIAMTVIKEVQFSALRSMRLERLTAQRSNLVIFTEDRV